MTRGTCSCNLHSCDNTLIENKTSTLHWIDRNLKRCNCSSWNIVSRFAILGPEVRMFVRPKIWTCWTRSINLNLWQIFHHMICIIFTHSWTNILMDWQRLACKQTRKACKHEKHFNVCYFILTWCIIRCDRVLRSQYCFLKIEVAKLIKIKVRSTYLVTPSFLMWKGYKPRVYAP